jgi:uncharacterized protein
MTAAQVSELLDLVPHPEEGGFFRETFRSAAVFEPGGAFGGTRSVATAIYYLLTEATHSALHRLPGDELFHFYLGDPVEMLMLSPDGTSDVIVLGSDLETMTLQHVVPAWTWQGARLVAGGKWALMGTTMAPGFDFRDYERGTRELVGRYPDRQRMIETLLRDETR